MSNNSQPRTGYVTPTRELERRWKIVRQAIELQQVDCLVMQNELGAMGGYVRYFADCQANPYRTTVLFPAREEMLLINHGSPGVNMNPPFWTPRGIQTSISSPYVQTFNFTENYAAEAAVKFIKDLRYKKIGWVNLTNLSAAFYRYLLENLPGVEFVDATDFVDDIKAVKGPDEIDAIRNTIDLHDQIIALVPQFLRPGRMEYEIRSDLLKASHDLCSEEQNIMVGSDPARSMMMPPMFQTRRVEAGDVLTCLVEVSGREGYFAEVGRIFSLGEPPADLVAAYEASLQGQRLAVQLIKPGADPAEIFKVVNEHLVDNGFNREERILAHGQGYDMVERPAFAPGETMKLRENMLIAVHVGAHGPKGGASSTDNYLITANGAELLTGTPQKIIVV